MKPWPNQNRRSKRDFPRAATSPGCHGLGTGATVASWPSPLAEPSKTVIYQVLALPEAASIVRGMSSDVRGVRSHVRGMRFHVRGTACFVTEAPCTVAGTAFALTFVVSGFNAGRSREAEWADGRRFGAIAFPRPDHESSSKLEDETRALKQVMMQELLTGKSRLL